MPSLLSQAFAKDNLLACTGYSALFIDNKTSIGIDKMIPAAYRKLLPEVEGNAKGVLHYTAMSVLYNSRRRVPFLSAYNIDGASKATVKRTGFKPDPRIDTAIQLSQQGFYDLRTDTTEFEIGHMAANNEMAWGKNAQLQSYQTFHFPNSVPQAENLNTGIWKTLETYLVDESAGIKKNKRICVFTGPVLRDRDPQYVKDPGFQIPLLFFKVIVFPTDKGLYSTGFLMSHEQRMRELGMFLPSAKPSRTRAAAVTTEAAFEDFKYRKVFQVNISMIEEQTGLSFTWPGVKKVKVPNDKNQVRKISKIKDAEDAKKAAGGTRGFVIPDEHLDDSDLTEQEIRKKSFKLNIILP